MSREIHTVTGFGIPLIGNDIDTDRIIPARFMKCVTFDGLGQYAFYDVRYREDGSEKIHPFNQNEFSKGSVLIVNKNFGCGSSREHAPQALMKYGIRALIGESFAEIFSGNATTMGIPAVCLSEKDTAELQYLINSEPHEEITIDLENKAVISGNRKWEIIMPESRRQALLSGTWDSTEQLLACEREIETKHRNLPYQFS